MSVRGTDEAELGLLLTAAQDGNRASYAAFLRAVVPLIRAVGRGKLARPADLEDFVQDTLLAVHQALPTFQPGRPVGPWLGAIARNRLSDALRRTYRRRAVETDFDDGIADTVAQPEAEPAPQVALGPLLSRLPERQRTAIEMLKVQGLSLKEASDASGVSIGALKVAVHRGIVGLRQLLRKEDDHG
ncbi:sigma-70 family RNA polymerase sigma factor [Niveispirillum lacus]|uniref:sigma-70 family RNA polymerase sigma factor n=1 Tax=Niveispirillum lacus TaxID=1981099 RepID=UPI0013FDA46E|nr:sigma-70 family RNA polymerase sigma factor [Niveispirillum lacus]